MMCVKQNTPVCDIFLLMDIAKMVGSKIKQARKLKGLTQKEVAKIFRMTQQQYSRFENGIFELNYLQIIELCKLFCITPNEIFDFDVA